ncbi:hypothetical protein COW36_08540 [bacterium (Candidatus Blackallbacteria) CG17_big_fil_post_rev_8_21_14_2_50_48_46]|uniref:F5/8 type C domain-containing protein n=1 Tax=bacterium (Candidatus Blackallbacteria) CG17_big_fil_post_rev_8_21_14_2_50_48_46 TaxID=2014261 RepID=A0A2M7G680_9BACT|nr:MAG: hypothetical protein COW64_05840 [bacterium (Candidatus Blackallbacteria) CG18_big_fil_WC_8_21_14_2_50_49_26]PIW17534.1 MAG: hypothetical protein COW36_08540 [bacterium (Candidatus Blackallbacteria) CG17_big_fil_post_rev_8_21_14_2_50_48_46]PIW48389.1 MAG: hypothetical protein COW20_09890 [bacterium (Candidatus Blackallbacteria) CG13_big_fil_rev_8_21_14_2_50_49_14]
MNVASLNKLKNHQVPVLKFLAVLITLSSFSACEALDLINTVGTVLAPSPSATPASGAAGLLQQLVSSAKATASPTPTHLSQAVELPAQPAPVLSAPVLTAQKINVVKPQDPNPLSVDWNLARQPNVSLSVSSELNPTFEKNRLTDGKLTTSWFSSASDTPSTGKLPTVEISFPQPVGIFGINLRGNRERLEGLTIQEVSLLISSPQGVLLSETITLPTQQTDLNLVLSKPVDGATSVRLTFTKDNSQSPGLSEIEVVGRS